MCFPDARRELRETPGSGYSAWRDRVDDQEFYQLLNQNGITDDIHLFNDKLGNGRTTTITASWRAGWTDAFERL
jgi:hypothetical protein